MLAVSQQQVATGAAGMASATPPTGHKQNNKTLKVLSSEDGFEEMRLGLGTVSPQLGYKVLRVLETSSTSDAVLLLQALRPGLAGCEPGSRLAGGQKYNGAKAEKGTSAQPVSAFLGLVELKVRQSGEFGAGFGPGHEVEHRLKLCRLGRRTKAQLPCWAPGPLLLTSALVHKGLALDAEMLRKLSPNLGVQKRSGWLPSHMVIWSCNR